MDKVTLPKKSGRLFRSRILEALTRTHPALIIGMYVPVCLLSLYYHYMELSGSILATIGIAFLGAFSWTLVEYLLHRFAFHFITDHPVVQKIHHLIHGVHHDFPTDKERLIMPPVPSLIIAGTFYLLFGFFMGEAVYSFLPGFILGYLAYAMVHYAIHAFKPPFEFLKPIWRHHHLHHHKHPDRAFGVSSPFWDLIFRTMPPEKKEMR
ncbi:MAG: sterol desaturase family protein [Bacteroidia bacterium]